VYQTITVKVRTGARGGRSGEGRERGREEWRGM